MKRFINEEKGLTLLEVVVSILIISIIFISLFSLFIQSKKTNVNAENISEATYIAQTEMEKIYIVSKTISRNSISQTSNFNDTYGFQQQIAGTCNNIDKTDFSYNNKYIYTKTVNNFLVELDISILCNYPHSTIIKITVSEEKDGTQITKAIVENAYVWKSN